jgi:glycosyltransferase involved in cell wall biosynthesis
VLKKVLKKASQAAAAQPGGVVYVQYTNPSVLPPVQHSAAIFVSSGWSVYFLSIQLEGEADTLRFSDTPGIHIERLRRYGPGWRLKLHYFVFVLWCWRRILRIKPALLYVSDPVTSPAGAFLSLVTSIPIVYHEHDSLSETPRRGIETLVAWTRGLLARRARLCVLPNELRAEAFTRTVAEPAPVYRVMNCPSIHEIGRHSRSERPSGAPFRLYYHGSIGPDRVPLTLLDALGLLPDCVQLAVVGFGTIGCPGYLRDFSAAISARGLQSRVSLLGTVTPRYELLELCSRHSLGLALLPMQAEDLNVRTSAGASNKIFEYLACGLPVLVADLPDHRRLFVEAGVAKACNPDSPESIAETILWFLDHPVETAEMGERGRKRVHEEWNYETQFQPVLDFVSNKAPLLRPHVPVSAAPRVD